MRSVVIRIDFGYDTLAFIQNTLYGHFPEPVEIFDKSVKEALEVPESHRRIS